MKCLICYGESSKIPMYECGHHFHSKCLHEWSNYDKQIIENYNEKDNFISKMKCPYCTQTISLYKSTRIDNNFISFYNNLRWLLKSFHIINSDYDEFYMNEQGICQICKNKDNISNMKIVEENIMWICGKCQTTKHKYNKETMKYNERKIELIFYIMSHMWNNRHLIRKNKKLMKLFLDKSKEVISDLNNHKQNMDKEDLVYSIELNKLCQKIMGFK